MPNIAISSWIFSRCSFSSSVASIHMLYITKKLTHFSSLLMELQYIPLSMLIIHNPQNKTLRSQRA